MRQLVRPLTLALAAGCAALVAAGCSGPASVPTAAQLLASAAAGLRSGRPCTVRGDVVLGPTDGNYDSVSSVSAGNRFSATITEHLAGADPLTEPQQFIDDGTALYFQDPVTLRLDYNGQVPAGLAGRWVRFPSWPGLSQKAYGSEFSELTHYPGPGGQAVSDLALKSASVPYEGGSCGLLVTQLRKQPDLNSPVVSGTLDQQPVFSFAISDSFDSVPGQRYRITVSQGTPVRLLRVTSGSDALSVSYPATIPPISAPAAAEVISPAQIPALSGSHQ